MAVVCVCLLLVEWWAWFRLSARPPITARAPSVWTQVGSVLETLPLVSAHQVSAHH